MSSRVICFLILCFSLLIDVMASEDAIVDLRLAHVSGSSISHIPATSEMRENADDKIKYELIRHLVWNQDSTWGNGLDWQRLREFYSAKQFKPVWLDIFGAGNVATEVRDVLVNAAQEGLDAKDYHVPAIRYMWRSKKAKTQARLELLLTDALLRYIVEVGNGYVEPQAADLDWYIPAKKIDPLLILESILSSHDVGRSLNLLTPQQTQYVALREKLKFYREMALLGEWPKLPDSSTLQLGIVHSNVVLLRERLFREGFLGINELDSPEFDLALQHAVKSFQKVNGHKIDGIVGRYTRKTLNVSLRIRINAIKHNMERWRWMPTELGDRYIVVNMAGYELALVEKGKTSLKMPIIIGKPYKATPTFADQMKYVEVNPVWNVPPRIVKETLLHNIQEDPNFLADNHFVIKDGWGKNARELNPEKINWQNLSEEWFPYKMEQTPGPHNSLGQLKFMFPNKFRIYLHDTPDKTLFSRHVRTFSSGCIRLSQPMALANAVLADHTSEPEHQIESLVASGETKRIALKHKLPVYLLYWTAWVDEQGELHFRPDIYNRNKYIATSEESITF